MTHSVLGFPTCVLSRLKLIGRMFPGDAVLLVDVQHVLADPSSGAADPGREKVL